MRAREVLLMSLFLTGHCTADGLPLDAPPTSPGIYDIESRLAGNRPARFTLALPADIERPTPRPLVVVLHYAGQPTRFYGRPLLEDLFEPAWRGLGAIFVAPESIDGQWLSETNEAFVLELIATIEHSYAIDPAQIVVAGYSMGAIGAWHFITHYPERFAAAVPVAGFPSGELACAVPVFTLATPSDEIFDFERLRTAVAAAAARGCRLELQSVAARGHYDISGFRSALGDLQPWLSAQLAQSTGQENSP